MSYVLSIVLSSKLQKCNANLGIPPTTRRAHPIVDLAPAPPPLHTPHAKFAATTTMPGAKTTLLIEGSFDELTDEFAQYIDSLKKSQGDDSAALQAETAELLKDNKKDEVLKKLVVASQALNQAPEKGMPRPAPHRS